MDATAPPAVVLARGLNGLGAVRSLGSSKVTVWTVVTAADSIPAASRLGRPFMRMKDESVAQVLARLAEHAEVTGAVVFATSDDDAMDIAASRNQLPASMRYAGPPPEVAHILADKRLETEQLIQHGVELPSTLPEPHNSEASLEVALSLPIIFKPITQGTAEKLGFKNVVVRSDNQLDSFLSAFSDRLDLFVAQEVIGGPDDHTWVCNATFNSSGEMVACHSFQRLGMSPPHFGVTTLALSKINEEVIAETARIGKALAYTGPAMMEFKLDPRDGRLKYIETNPRLGMCNWFDTRCGVNNAYRAYLVALGDDASRVPRQIEGAYFIDLYNDLSSRLVDDRVSLAQVLRTYRKLMWRRRIGAYFWLQDLRPTTALIRRRSKETSERLNRRMRRMEFTSAVGGVATRTFAGRPFRPAIEHLMVNRACVFMLHRRLGVERPDTGHDPALIDETVEALDKAGCRFASLEEIGLAAAKGLQLPARTVAFSIDDGYEDQLELADRFLTLGVPITVFVLSDLVDGLGWPWDAKLSFCLTTTNKNEVDLEFDGWRLAANISTHPERIRTLRTLREHGKLIDGSTIDAFVTAVSAATEVHVPATPPLQYKPADWGSLRTRATRGLSVAPHSCTHRVFSMLDDETAERELSKSWKRVRDEIAGSPAILAWPTGRSQDFTERDLRLARDLGFLAAFATNDDYSQISSQALSRFALNRFSLPRRADLAVRYGTGVERLMQFFRGSR